MGRIAKDAKDLLIGNDGSDKEPNDFKTELQGAIKSGIVSKSDGTLLITSRMNSDKLGEKIDKRQTDGVKKIKDNELYNSLEEELEAQKEKEAKEKEKERKRREKENQLAKQMQENAKKSEQAKNNNPIREESQKDIGEKQ